jgi:hypothetical protein
MLTRETKENRARQSPLQQKTKSGPTFCEC